MLKIVPVLNKMIVTDGTVHISGRLFSNIDKKYVH